MANATSERSTDASSQRAAAANDAPGQAVSDEKKVLSEQKRTEKSKEQCEKKSADIVTRMASIAEQGEKQIAVFDKISQKVQEFYSEKNYTVADYTSLLNAVTVSKAAAEKAIGAVSRESSSFSCDAEDPKLNVEAFKAAVITKNETLKAYKTSIKDLIVAIKSSATDGDTVAPESSLETEQQDEPLSNVTSEER